MIWEWLGCERVGIRCKTGELAEMLSIIHDP